MLTEFKTCLKDKSSLNHTIDIFNRMIVEDSTIIRTEKNFEGSCIKLYLDEKYSKLDTESKLLKLMIYNGLIEQMKATENQIIDEFGANANWGWYIRVSCSYISTRMILDKYFS